MRYVTSVSVFLFYIQTLQCHSYHENSRLNFFDTDLLRYTSEDRPGNVVVSPASIKSTLAMLLEGANGITADEIRSALRLVPDKVEYREQLNQYLNALKTNSSKVIIENANAVFISDALKIHSHFELMLKNIYLTQVFRANFGDAYGTSLSVNNWVNASTRGLIPSIVEPALIDPRSNILFANALYFKSTWKYSFDPHLTHGACFQTLSGCRKVEMMHLTAELNYAYVDNLRAHAVELPYEGGRYSMIVLVPLDQDGLFSVIRDLPYMSLPQIVRLMEPNDLELSMPKFVVDFSEDMARPLAKMRINSLFTPACNLSGIFEGGSTRVTNIYHKVFLSVDETGTVAAAATAAVVIPLIQNGVTLTVDRPFVFFIRDNSAGLTLFEGKIEEPTEFVEKIKAPASKHNSNRQPSYFKRIFG